MKTAIGERIRRLRLLKGYSQENMAEDLGISFGAYAKIERGETDPNTARLYQIARVLGVPIAELFEDAQPNVREGKSGYGYATKEDVENLQEMIQALRRDMEKMREQLPAAARGKKSGRKRK